MKKILITGSLGLVGSACIELFTAKGWEVVGIDNNGRSSFFGTDWKKGAIDLDIRNRWSIEGLFKEHTFDAIVHAAGQPSHDWATDHVFEDLEVNLTGTVVLLEATRKYCPEATFVYVSSDKVYGENMVPKYPGYLKETETRYDCLYPFDESLGLDFAGDRSLFGCSKAAADMYVQCYGAKFGMKTACFRPGCITGKNHAGAEQHGFLAYLTKCLKEGKEYKIHGNGKQVRDQIHASDLAAAFYEFIRTPKSGAVYNIGGGPERSVSVLEAIDLIYKGLEAQDIQPPSKIISYGKERDGDRKWDVHDISKFRHDYPEWDYKYSLDAIIRELCWDGFL